MMKLVCLFVIFGLLAVSIAQEPLASTPPPSFEPHSFEVPLARTDAPYADSPRSLEPETEIQRNFEFGFASDQIDARIQLRSNGTEHELRHQIGAAATGAEFIVEFEQNVNDTKSTLRMRLRLFELIEYIPDSTPGYQNETVVNSYRYWNWGKGLVDTTPSSNDSKIYTLKTADKLFGLVIRINKPENGTLAINPEDVKFDIEFDVEALRAAGWLNGTEVALKAVVVSRLESEKQHDDDSKQTENSINVGSSGASQFGALFVSWINYIQCDVNKVSVVSSAMRVDNTQVEADDDSDSTAHVVAFAFINLKDQSNTTCVWDPVVSASAADTTSSSSPTSTTTTTASSDAASVVASLAVFAAAMVALF